MNFDPRFCDETFRAQVFINKMNIACDAFAEATITRMIKTGSGGPENMDITDQGLRFVRYLMCNRPANNWSTLPNFKDEHSVREMARRFISHWGSPISAVEAMYKIIG
ncbi:hypothetical protein KA183_20310 [bacterium]|nr:hypothetical protein [bacterium]QQR59031.1 MAG: hypothetical protein IPG59_05925 [Candidatus Melainabacteria bacterium]